MNRESLDTWCERAILALVVAALVFGILALGGVRGTELVFVQWLICAATAVWIVRLWVSPKFRLLLPPTCWAVLPFIGYAIWRYRTADIEFVARQEFLQVLLACAVFFLIVNNLYGQERLRALAVALIVVAMGNAMYAVYQWLTGSDHVWQFVRPGYEGRGSGTYISPNHLAGFLEMVFPLAAAFTLLCRFKPVPRIGLGYASCIILVGIAATGSRAAWVAVAISILIFAATLVRRRSHAWAALALLLVVGGTGTFLYSRALAPRLRDDAGEIAFRDIRLKFWVSAWQMWKDHPWTGVGPGHFDHRYRKYRQPTWETQSRPVYAHNDYANTLADWGLVGLLLVLAPVGVAGFGVIKSWRLLQRSSGISGLKIGNRAALVLGSSIGLLAILVHSWFDFNMHIPANALVAVTLLAIVTASWRFATERYWVSVRWPAKLLLTLLLISLTAYLGRQTWTRTNEASALRAARATPHGSVARASALERAYAIEPRNAETAFQIAEQFRHLSLVGDPDHEKHARAAVEWYQRAIALNRWDIYSHLHAGMCLDWIDRHADAEPFFHQAIEMGPNDWYARAMMGWHEFQVERFASARDWMDRSLELKNMGNTIAHTYKALAERSMAAQQGAPQ